MSLTYDTATLTEAGSSGTQAQCKAVIDGVFGGNNTVTQDGSIARRGKNSTIQIKNFATSHLIKIPLSSFGVLAILDNFFRVNFSSPSRSLSLCPINSMLFR